MIILIIIFAILNIFDGISTYLVVSNSSLRSERNPFARFVFKTIGLKTGIIVLKSISILIIPLYYIFRKPSYTDVSIVLSIANVLYIYVVINNYKHFFRIRKRREFK